MAFDGASGWMLGDGKDFLTHMQNGQEFSTPYSQFVYFMHPHAEAINTHPLYIGLGLAAAGLALAWWQYGSGGYELDKKWENSALRPLYLFSFNRWYMDNLYLGGAALVINVGKTVWEIVDKFIVDGFVNSWRWITLGLGNFLKFTENGRGQAYALLIFASVAVLGLLAYFVFVP
jgi:hypothetical protein